MTLVPGSKLGPYEIVSPAGAGGMGEVYKAKDPRLDGTVAIKVLPMHIAGNADLTALVQSLFFDPEFRIIVDCAQ